MWSTNSALPVERSVRVRNDKDMYLAAQPVDDMDFPWDMNDLPDNFRSPAWTNVRDPVHNSERLHPLLCCISTCHLVPPLITTWWALHTTGAKKCVLFLHRLMLVLQSWQHTPDDGNDCQYFWRPFHLSL